MFHALVSVLLSSPEGYIKKVYWNLGAGIVGDPVRKDGIKDFK